MVAVGYARESSADAAKELAYDYQVERLQEYGCQWVYGDRITGTKDNRSGLEKALDKIKSGEADELVVSHLFRLARSVVTINRVIKLLKEKGSRLTILGGSINTETPEGRAFLQSQAVWGEYEAELGAERQRIGWENTLKKGRPRAPVFGYTIANGEYVPDTQTRSKDGIQWNNWEVARRILDRIGELGSFHATTVWIHQEFAYMRDEPRQQRPPFTERGLKVWAQNPVLLGHVYFKGGVVRHLDRHPPLLDLGQLQELRDILRRNTPPGQRIHDRRYAYTGLVFCGMCGARAGTIQSEKRSARARRKHPDRPSEKYLYYRCTNARIHKCENTARVQAQKIEDFVMAAIADRAEAITSVMARSIAIAPPVTDSRILDLQARIDRLMPVAEIDPRIRATIADLEREIANLQHNEITAPTTKGRQESAAILRSLSTPAYWETLTAKEKHARLKNIIRQVLIVSGVVVGVEFQPRFDLPFAATPPADPAVPD